MRLVLVCCVKFLDEACVVFVTSLCLPDLKVIFLPPCVVRGASFTNVSMQSSVATEPVSRTYSTVRTVAHSSVLVYIGHTDNIVGGSVITVLSPSRAACISIFFPHPNVTHGYLLTLDYLYSVYGKTDMYNICRYV